MKRFTKRIDEHVYFTMGKYPETLPLECTPQDVRQVLKHLADYEDLNLIPEEISSLITTIESQQKEMKRFEHQNTVLSGANTTLGRCIQEKDTLIESQKEEIEKLELDLFPEWIQRRDELQMQINSLKAITELAVKGMEYVQSFPFLEPSDDTRTIKRHCHITLTDIARIQNAQT